MVEWIAGMTNHSPSQCNLPPHTRKWRGRQNGSREQPAWFQATWLLQWTAKAIYVVWGEREEEGVMLTVAQRGWGATAPLTTFAACPNPSRSGTNTLVCATLWAFFTLGPFSLGNAQTVISTLKLELLACLMTHYNTTNMHLSWI